jgi:hypothetical protein
MAKRKTDEQEAPEVVEAEPTAMTVEAQPAKSVNGLADDEAIEIRHPDTGQEYGVSVKAYKDLYQPVGYLPVRKGDNTLLPGTEGALDPEAMPEPAPAPIYPEVEVEDGPVTPNVGDTPQGAPKE